MRSRVRSSHRLQPSKLSTANIRGADRQSATETIQHSMVRREFLTEPLPFSRFRQAETQSSIPRKGRIKQCLTTMNFDPAMPFDTMCRHAAHLGCKGFDAIDHSMWPILKAYGLVPSLAFPPLSPPPFTEGIARKENHTTMERLAHESIDLCGSEWCPNIPIACGTRRGMSYHEGAENCVDFFNRTKAPA